MSVPVTPVRRYPILAKHRSTRKGQRLCAPISGEIGVDGRHGVHYYNIVLAPAGGGRERLTCDCPAFRYGRAHIVRETGMCKHMHDIRETLSLDPEVDRTRCGDIIIYAADALRRMLGLE